MQNNAHMTNKLEIYGLDLSSMGIGDVGGGVSDGSDLGLVLNEFARQILGSITFGPQVEVFEIELTEDDEDWPLAE